MNNDHVLANRVRKNYEGKVFKTKTSGDCIVVKYNNNQDILIEFLETGNRKIVRSGALKCGVVKDRGRESVYSFGIVGDMKISSNGVHFASYSVWSSMIERCYSEKRDAKWITYKDCSVSEEFKYYENFKEWCEKQIGFNSKDETGRSFELDKDILFKGNKIYSSETCVFVPLEINQIFRKSERWVDTKETMIGTCLSRNKKHVARIRIKGKLKHLGTFNTEAEAYESYKASKTEHIRSIAEKWRGMIDERVYEILMNYEIDG